MAKSIAPLDLAFLLTESADSPKHVGVLLTFEAPKGGSAKVAREAVAAYRAARPTLPFNQIPDLSKLAMPSWKKTDLFDAEYHVSHLLLPPGSTHDNLLKLVCDLTEPVMDRNRPLFRVWFIEGLADGSFAMFIKVHHAIIDGKSAMDRIGSAFGTTATAPLGKPFFALDETPDKPKVPKYLLHRLVDMQSSARKQGLALASVSFGLLKKGVSRVLTHAASGSIPFIAPRGPMNEPIRAPRSFATLSLPLAEMRAVGKAFGGTINDVAVALFDEGVHRYLRDIGKDIRVPLAGMLPVSLRDEGDREATTKASMMFVPLGAPSQKPGERLEQVIRGIRAAKDDMRRMSKDAAVIYALATFGLGELNEATAAKRVSNALANFVLSNVPGLPHAVYLNGAKLKGLYPVSTMGGGIGLNATLASYNGTMDFGLVASSLSMPSLHGLAQHCLDAFADLKEAAAARTAADPVSAPVAAANVVKKSPKKAPKTGAQARQHGAQTCGEEVQSRARAQVRHDKAAATQGGLIGRRRWRCGVDRSGKGRPHGQRAAR